MMYIIYLFYVFLFLCIIYCVIVFLLFNICCNECFNSYLYNIDVL